jgi:transcriptional regulator with XRE-family HTH domain
MSYLAKNILHLRKQKDLTQSKMCADIGIPRNTLSNWENDVSVPDLDKIVQLADYFNVDLTDFITVDMSDSNLIQNEKEAKNRQNSYLNSNPKRYPIAQNEEVTHLVQEAQTAYKTASEELKKRDKTISQLSDILESQAQEIKTLKAQLAQLSPSR